MFYCVSLILDNAIFFFAITPHVRFALKSEYLFVAGVKPFPANQIVKYECIHCAFQIFHILPVVCIQWQHMY